jgi:hypothetical protein
MAEASVEDGMTGEGDSLVRSCHGRRMSNLHVL